MPSPPSLPYGQSLPVLNASLDRIRSNIAGCERCPRLRAYCTNLGVVKRRAYLDHTY